MFYNIENLKLLEQKRPNLSSNHFKMARSRWASNKIYSLIFSFDYGNQYIDISNKIFYKIPPWCKNFSYDIMLFFWQMFIWTNIYFNSFSRKTLLTSVTRLGDLLNFGQLFKAICNNQFAQISHILRQFL